MPPLVARYLELIAGGEYRNDSSKEGVLFEVINTLLYTLCKVRGVNVIIRFFNNEPKYIEPLLQTWSNINNNDSPNALEADDSTTWQIRYVLLLWLSHLMLTPFDLESISSPKTSLWPGCLSDIPPKAPQLARDVLKICLETLSAIGKEQSAAARLLVRLVVRPDMRSLGLLDAVVVWSTKNFATQESSIDSTLENRQAMGILNFISGLTKSANSQDNGQYLLLFYESIICSHAPHLQTRGHMSSATSMQKLLIKIYRNIVLQSLQLADTEAGRVMLDDLGALENGISYFLDTLADRDTQVRYCGSKALAAITAKLDAAMAEDVVAAILSSLTEDISVEAGAWTFQNVNAARWHGLTLTLAHLLFRRSPPPHQLSEIIDALILSLKFEQRSSSGSSLGANVRDAANFGLWSLARRYTTSELDAVHTLPERSASWKTVFGVEGDTAIREDVFHRLACELVNTACLDPEGNIRRGSSAALQELVGRHPNNVMAGIDLIQVVDYQAVGLRRRAVGQISLSAAALHIQYRDSLLMSLFDWRGVAAAEPVVWRQHAAVAIGELSSLLDPGVAFRLLSFVQGRLHDLPAREREQRGALLHTLAEVVSQSRRRLLVQDPYDVGIKEEMLDSLCGLWQLFDGWLGATFKESASRNPEPRIEYIAVPTIRFISSLSECSLAIQTLKSDTGEMRQSVIRTYSYCLRRLDQPGLDMLTESSLPFFMLLPYHTLCEMAGSWLEDLSRPTNKQSVLGALTALASIWSTMWSKQRHSIETEARGTAARATTNDILSKITDLSHNVDPHIRVQSIRCIGIIVRQAKAADLQHLVGDFFGEMLHAALNDYQIDERGDIGSLVRLEGLASLRVLCEASGRSALPGIPSCHVSVHRLSLERLDKVRALAGQMLGLDKGGQDMSSEEYFVAAARLILHNMKDGTPASRVANDYYVAFLEGFASSTSTGSETTIVAARAALCTILTSLPLIDQGQCCLMDMGNALCEALAVNTSAERVTTPLLELTSYLFDARLLQRLIGTEFKWRTLLSRVQKAHFKSSNISKLVAATHIYRNLYEVESIRREVLTRLAGMLENPIAKVRVEMVVGRWTIGTNDRPGTIGGGRSAMDGGAEPRAMAKGLGAAGKHAPGIRTGAEDEDEDVRTKYWLRRRYANPNRGWGTPGKRQREWRCVVWEYSRAPLWPLFPLLVVGWCECATHCPSGCWLLLVARLATPHLFAVTTSSFSPSPTLFIFHHRLH